MNWIFDCLKTTQLCTRFTSRNIVRFLLVLISGVNLAWRPHHCLLCHYCKAKLVSHEIYTEHMRLIHTAQVVPPVYPCGKCSFITTRPESLAQHHCSGASEEAHLEAQKPHEAERASSSLSSISASLSDLSNGFTCADCHQSFKSVAGITDHLQTCSTSTLVKKNINPTMVANVASDHLLLEEASSITKNLTVPWTKSHIFCCNHGKCNRIVKSKMSYHYHMKAKHINIISQAHEKFYPCASCNYVCHSQTLARAHIALHHADNAIGCTRCPFLAPDRSGLEEHHISGNCSRLGSKKYAAQVGDSLHSSSVSAKSGVIKPRKCKYEISFPLSLPDCFSNQ